ncbi:hypothetical protein DERF_009219 [Dermatophagoides farinae]|uniref:Uncharacterized protein n=1 Tax=Dermatophagoides farinae TaxID=6954 RepID=A0A922HTJ5_DERFA|nr:hypothetical protein HUG17_7172 [Dermatophagoides farinae]KAH9510710.1 hypothetical protein DERF_009219 [Dermatophagoides farinae]
MDSFTDSECLRLDIIDDWKNREFMHKITDLFTNFTNKLNRMGIVWQTKMKILNQKLEIIEKQINLLENQIYSNNNFNKMVIDYEQKDFDDDFE